MRKRRRPPRNPDVYIRICTRCGEAFETTEIERDICTCCPPKHGGTPPVQARDDHDAGSWGFTVRRNEEATNGTDPE